MSWLSQDRKKRCFLCVNLDEGGLFVEIEAGFGQGTDEANAFLGCRVSGMWTRVLGV